MAAVRILQVFTIMNRGGAESMIMNYYRQLDKSKIQFDFLVHRQEKAAFDDEIESMGGKIYRMNPINPLNPGSYYNQLRTFFKEHQEYKIVHSHLNTFSSFVLKIAKEFNIPCRIAHAHIAIEDTSLSSMLSSKSNFIEGIKNLMKLRLKKNIHKYPTHYFSCGDKAGKWLFGEDAEFYTMNNAIDTDRFLINNEVRDRYRAEFNVEDNWVFGHIGRFNTQKNHLFLLQIFREVVKLKDDARLFLIGDGNLRNEIEAEISRLGLNGSVTLLGVRSDVPDLFQMFDVFVFPSLYEGLPVTLIEAQAAGLKIYASDTITDEVLLTDDINFISLNKSTEHWTQEIVKSYGITKSNNRDKIVEGNYDIVSNTRAIEQFYLKQLNA